MDISSFLVTLKELTGLVKLTLKFHYQWDSIFPFYKQETFTLKSRSRRAALTDGGFHPDRCLEGGLHLLWMGSDCHQFEPDETAIFVGQKWLSTGNFMWCSRHPGYSRQNLLMSGIFTVSEPAGTTHSQVPG